MTKAVNVEEANVVKGPACSAGNFFLIKFNSMTDDLEEEKIMHFKLTSKLMAPHVMTCNWTKPIDAYGAI